MYASASNEILPVLEYPISPPSSPRSPIPRSSLRLSTTIKDSSTFEQVPTPRSAGFQTPSPVYSKPLPSIPPQWLWRCHLCGFAYALGTTRRCLNDGHYFCAGTSISKKTGKRKIHAPCGSTFDYIGWQKYGDWRRGELKLLSMTDSKPKASTNIQNPFSTYFSGLMKFRRAEEPRKEEDLESSSSAEDTDMTDELSPLTPLFPRKLTNCEHQCNYPSECRWGKKMNPITDKKKHKTKKSIDIVLATPGEPTPLFYEKNPELIEDEDEYEEQDTPNPPVKQESLAPPSPSSVSEFHIELGSLRRSQSFSRPFASYSWLKMPSGTPIGPPSPPLSVVLNPMEEIRPQYKPRKDSWPLRSLTFPHPRSSIEFPEESDPESPPPYRDTFRHRLLTPETTPEPPSRLGYSNAAVEMNESEFGSESESSSSASSGLPSPASLEWNWDVGGWPYAWDRRFGMAGEAL